MPDVSSVHRCRVLALGRVAGAKVESSRQTSSTIDPPCRTALMVWYT